MEENKQVVAEWKALNQPRLQEIKKANPELYSAVNLALQYLNQKLGGEELPAEVEIVEEVVETTPMSTKQWTLNDFKDIKIFVNTPEKSRKFQELFLSLGGKWSSLDVRDPDMFRKVNNTDKKYLITTEGVMLFYDAPKNFDSNANKEIYYEDIFSSQVAKKQLTKDDFLNKKIILDTEEMSKKFQLFVYSLGLMWSSGENKTPILLNEKYIEIDGKGRMSYTNYKDTFTQFTKEEIFYYDIFPEEVPQTTPETQSATSQSQYKWPIETYPPTLKYPSWNLNFEKNNGDRKSPTQSAGDLKRNVNKLGQATDYMRMILETKFKGNDGDWYEINIGKGGVWTWKKTTPPSTQSTSFTSTSSAQSTPAPAKKVWKPEDLVGKKLLWNAQEYDVIKFRRNNPKYKSYTLRTASGIEVEGKLTMSAIEKLLNDEPVKGISIIKPPTQPTNSNSFEDSLTSLSDVELKQLYDDTEAAKSEFDASDPEYTELRLQLVTIANEMDKRNI